MPSVTSINSLFKPEIMWGSTNLIWSSNLYFISHRIMGGTIPHDTHPPGIYSSGLWAEPMISELYPAPGVLDCMFDISAVLSDITSNGWHASFFGAVYICLTTLQHKYDLNYSQKLAIPFTIEAAAAWSLYSRYCIFVSSRRQLMVWNSESWARNPVLGPTHLLLDFTLHI